MAVAEATGNKISFFPRARTGARWLRARFFLLRNQELLGRLEHPISKVDIIFVMGSC